MKKILLFAAILAFVAGCNNSAKRYANLQEEQKVLNAALTEIFNDTTLTETEQDRLGKEMLGKAYDDHREDSLGLSIFITMVSNFCEPQEAIAMFDDASEMIRENDLAKTKILALRNLENAKVGNDFIEITGPDAITAETLSISSFLGQGKPVLLDFWASWCGPCRKEIKNSLLDLAESGEMTILGIAVWESALENTVGAMSELGISWPVIFTGGRENSPSILYGVCSIPTLILLSPEGKILARGHSLEEIRRQAL